MRPSRLVVPALVLVAACGPTQPVATVVVAAAPAQSASTVAPPAPLAPVDPSLPAGAAAVLSVDTLKLVTLFEGMAHAHWPGRRALARALGVEQGLLQRGEVFVGLPLDPARPIVASAWLTPGARDAVARVRAVQAREPSTDQIGEELRRAFDGAAGAALALRIVVPSTDAGTVVRTVGARLLHEGWKAEAAPEGVERLYTFSSEDAFAGISQGTTAVVVDILLPIDDTDRKHGRATVLEALRAIRHRTPESPHEEPPSLDGAVARARWTPAAMADMAFLERASHVLSTHPGAMAKQGLDEAAQAYALAGDPRGAYFERFEAWIEGGYGSIGGGIRAVPGPAAQIAPAAWAPGVAAVIPGVSAWLDVSLPWHQGWVFPGDDPRSSEHFFEQARQAGELCAGVVLPSVLAADAWEPMRWFEQYPTLVGRLERAAIFRSDEDGHEGVFGVLAAGTTPADAACAPVVPRAPCAPEKKLRPGAALQIDDRWVKLAQVKGRWTVLASSERDVVEKMKIDLAPAPAAPVRFAFPGGTGLAHDLRLLPPMIFPARYLVEASLEAGQPTVRMRPAPAH